MRVPRRSLPPLLSAAGLLWRPAVAAAQSGAANFPERPITLVVPFLAGGSTDIAGRILAECEFRRSQPAIPIEASHLIRVKPAGHSD
jgi:hypothetical protein